MKLYMEAVRLVESPDSKSGKTVTSLRLNIMNEQDKRRAEFHSWMRANYGAESLWRNPCNLPLSDFIWQGWNAALDRQKKHTMQMNGLKPEVIICSECGTVWRIGKEEPPCEHLSNLREQIKAECRDW